MLSRSSVCLDRTLSRCARRSLGFTGDSISPLGAVTLPLTLGAPPRSKTVMSTFLVVDLPTAYNVILSRQTLNKIRAVVSTYHRTIKFPTHAGAGEVRGSPRESRRCYLMAVSLHKRARTEQPLWDPREMKKLTLHPEPTAPTCGIPWMKDQPDRTIRIGSELPNSEREQLVLIVGGVGPSYRPDLCAGEKTERLPTRRQGKEPSPAERPD